jgi:predicted PurR-regulated permease PerM
MNEVDIQKIQDAWEVLQEQLKPIADAIVKIFNDIRKKLIKIFRNVVIAIVKYLDDKKACKCLHIWLHSKNRRIRKKQSKRLNKIILSYMPL